MRHKGVQWRAFRYVRMAVVAVLTLSMVAASLVAYAFPEPPPTFQLKWGSNGSGPGQFTNLEFLAADSAGNIYVTDAYDPIAGNHRIQKFSPNGVFLSEWGTVGAGLGQFTTITYIAIDALDRVWVVDRSPGPPFPPVYRRVQRFTTAGAFIDAPPWLQFNDIGAILFDPTNGDVLAVSHDPAFVRRFNDSGTLLAQFSVGALPRSGVVDSAGNIYLSLNRGLGPVAKYSPAGVHLPPVLDMGGNQLAIDPSGNLYGTSTNPAYGAEVVRKVSPGNVVLTQWGSPGTGDGQFQAASGLVRVPDGRIYVAEFNGKRIQRFGTAPLDTLAPTTAASASGYVFGTWTNANVNVALSATDDAGGSGVKELTYAATGAQSIPTTVQAGSAVTVSISAEGITTLTFFATDNAGNIEDTQTRVIKIDRTAPTASCSASPSSMWPPNHRMVNVAVTVSVLDALSGDGGSTLVSVTSNEPDNGLGDGDTAGDIAGWAVGTGDTTGQLRAERAGGGNGRVYTLTYEARDGAANTTTTQCTVTVPKNRS